MSELDQCLIGDHAKDREDDEDGRRLCVVGVEATPAEEYALSVQDGEVTTVADLNEKYDPTDSIVHVVYQQHGTMIDLDKTYAFPRGRLMRTQPLSPNEG